MKYKQLGRTGMFVSELCLGTMTLGGGAQAGMWSSIGAVEQEEANQLIAKALAGGVNFIDTADIYAFGQSERMTGNALRETGVARSDIVLATKTGGVMGKGPNDRGASRGHGAASPGRAAPATRRPRRRRSSGIPPSNRRSAR